MCNSSIVQDRFCSIKCYAPSLGKHSYTNVKTSTNKNFVNLSSLYQCGHKSNGVSGICHYYGDQTLVSTNITKTICSSYACYSFSQNPVNINFCCFISNDNHQLNPICAHHSQTPDSFVSKSVFKNNSAQYTDTSNGFLCSSLSSNVTVSECIFLENVAKTTFSASFGSILTAIRCIGENLTVKSYTGIVNTDKMNTDPFILPLPFLSLVHCKVEYPPLFDIPLFISRKKKKRYFRFNFTLAFFILIID